MLPAAAHLPFYIVDHKLLFYSGDRYESTAMKRQMRAPRSAPHIKLCNTTTPLILGWQATDGDAPVVAPDQPAVVPFDREARPGHAHASHSSRRSSLSALVTRGSSQPHESRRGQAPQTTCSQPGRLHGACSCAGRHEAVHETLPMHHPARQPPERPRLRSRTAQAEQRASTGEAECG